MKPIFLTLLVPVTLAVFSCSDASDKTNTTHSSEQSSETTNPSDTISKQVAPAIQEQFRTFRDALYRKDKAAVAAFFDFPVYNENNELWCYITEGSEEEISRKEPRPFSAKDFEKHFDQLFTGPFVKILLKVKSEKLFSTGTYSTELIALEETASYRLYANYKEDELTLHLYSETQPEEEDEMDFPIEFSTTYYFKVDASGKLKFSRIRLAG